MADDGGETARGGGRPHATGWDAILDGLVAAGVIGVAAAARARRASEETGEPVDRVLTQLGLVAEAALLEGLSAITGLAVARAEDYGGAGLRQETRISSAFLRRRRLVPLADDGTTVTVAVADPTDAEALDALAQATGRRIELRLGLASDIAAALEQEAGGDAPGAEGEAASSETDVERLRDLASEAPVIRLANRIIARAIDMRASDIHLEPVEDGLRVRYRIDGALRDEPAPPPGTEAALVSRIKIIARLDIAERRLPQDGRIGITHRGRRIDLRISTVPGLHGEAVALRILDRSAVALDLERLIPPGATQERWAGLLERPNGILLMTGPTGSGKTTTLYASLKRIARPERKILTVEDPVEFALEGALQVQVKTEIGLDFPRALRAFLRHDPDIVMVGEIRDRETAEIAVQAALTGHLVLSTLHTNSAAASIPRLLDMGIEGFLLASVVIGAGAQRLLRTLCPDCRTAYEPPAAVIERFGLAALAPDGPPRLWRGAGCAACGGSGYHGRAAVLEVLEVDDAMRELVMSRGDAASLDAAARRSGMETLFEAGLRLALEGRTSLEEVLRATRTT